MSKYIAFMYIGEENCYVFVTESNDLTNLVTIASSKKGVWTVVYEYDGDEHYGYLKGERYEYLQTINGIGTKSHLTPTPMNKVINMPVPINHTEGVFTRRWMWMN